MNNYYKYWGKAQKKEDGIWDYHLLPYHYLDVAAVEAIVSRWLQNVTTWKCGFVRINRNYNGPR